MPLISITGGKVFLFIRSDRQIFQILLCVIYFKCSLENDIKMTYKQHGYVQCGFRSAERNRFDKKGTGKIIQKNSLTATVF